MDAKQFWNKVLYGLKWFFFSFIWLFVVCLVTDIVTKQVIVNYFKSHSEPILILGTEKNPFLRINYTLNENAAFGFGTGNALANRIIYIIVAIIGFGIIVGIFAWKFKSHNRLVRACLMLMATGAFGNLIDRLFYSKAFLATQIWPDVANAGCVVDWIDFCGIWGYNFNIADSCVVVGTITLIIYFIVEEIRDAVKRRKEEVKEPQEKILSKEEKERLEAEQKQDADVVEKEESSETPNSEFNGEE